MKKVAQKESNIYTFVQDFIRKNSYPPSVRDIQTALDIKSTSTVHNYLHRMKDKGMIEFEDGKSRCLRIGSVSPVNKTSTKIPVVGKVAAGAPILAVENIEGYLDFPLVKNSLRDATGSLFALRVSGESMIEAGILDGDIVVVQKESTAENGEIVVALVDDSATVKTFYRENGHYRLQPENRTMDPIIVSECLLLGKVVSVMRFYS